MAVIKDMSSGIIILLLFLSVLFILKVIYLLSTTLLLPITKGALFVPTSSVRIKTITEAVPMDTHETFMDLGCGHGQVLRYVHRKHGLKATGFEVNPLAFTLSYLLCLFYPRIKIKYGNFWKQDLSQTDIIFCYLFPDVMDRLGAKLRRELKPGSRVISCNFPLPHWRPVDILKPDSSRHNAPVYIYRLPESCI